MVNRFFSTFGALAIFALLVGFGGATPAVKVKIPAIPLSNVAITHHFSATGQIGTLDGGTSYPPIAVVMPAGSGLAISQINITGVYTNSTGTLTVRVDGNPVWKKGQAYASGWAELQSTIIPPLIVPPGALLEIGTDGSYVNATVTGYTLDASYFGP